MSDTNGRTIVTSALVVVAILIIFGSFLDDPFGLGSTDFYALTAMGVGFAAWRGTEVTDRGQAVLVGTALALGGLLMGVGTLPLSHPVTDPVVGGEGPASIAGFVLFLVGVFGPDTLPGIETTD